MYIFFKIFFGIVGALSLIIFIFFSFLIINFFFNDPLIGKEILNYESVCGTNITSSLTNKKCEDLMTIYWLLVMAFSTLIISLLTIYPFLKIKKNNI